MYIVKVHFIIYIAMGQTPYTNLLFSKGVSIEQNDEEEEEEGKNICKKIV